MGGLLTCLSQDKLLEPHANVVSGCAVVSAKITVWHGSDLDKWEWNKKNWWLNLSEAWMNWIWAVPWNKCALSTEADKANSLDNQSYWVYQLPSVNGSMCTDVAVCVSTSSRDLPGALCTRMLAVPSVGMVSLSRRHSIVATGLDITSQLMFTGFPSHEKKMVWLVWNFGASVNKKKAIT